MPKCNKKCKQQPKKINKFHPWIPFMHETQEVFLCTQEVHLFFICSSLFSWIQNLMGMVWGMCVGEYLFQVFPPEVPTQIKTMCCLHYCTPPIVRVEESMPSTILSPVEFLCLDLDVNILWMLFHTFSHISLSLQVKGVPRSGLLKKALTSLSIHGDT